MLLALGYAAWPAWSAWQLRAAVKARDIQPASSARSTGRSCVPTSSARSPPTCRTTPRAPDAGFFGKAVKRTLGPLVANRVIDAAVTPRTLARVLAGRLDAVEITRDVPVGAMPAPSDAEASNDPLSPRRLRWAFFESPARFRIEVADRTEPGKRVVSIFALQGASWKLVDVYYRTLT